MTKFFRNVSKGLPNLAECFRDVWKGPFQVPMSCSRLTVLGREGLSAVSHPHVFVFLRVLVDAELQLPPFSSCQQCHRRAGRNAAGIRRPLQDQVTSTLRWSDCMEWMLGRGCDLFIELGPGGVLAGLLRRTRKGTEVIRVSDSASVADADYLAYGKRSR